MNTELIDLLIDTMEQVVEHGGKVYTRSIFAPEDRELVMTNTGYIRKGITIANTKISASLYGYAAMNPRVQNRLNCRAPVGIWARLIKAYGVNVTYSMCGHYPEMRLYDYANSDHSQAKQLYQHAWLTLEMPTAADCLDFLRQLKKEL